MCHDIIVEEGGVFLPDFVFLVYEAFFELSGEIVGGGSSGVVGRHFLLGKIVQLLSIASVGDGSSDVCKQCSKSVIAMQKSKRHEG